LSAAFSSSSARSAAATSSIHSGPHTNPFFSYIYLV
jgi:hypothetical protein